jgi:hypothetical protein
MWEGLAGSWNFDCGVVCRPSKRRVVWEVGYWMRYETGGINGSWREGERVMRWMLTGIRCSIRHVIEVLLIYGIKMMDFCRFEETYRGVLNGRGGLWKWMWF